MPKRITQIINTPQVKIPVIGLFLLSAFGVGFTISRPKPVLSSESTQYTSNDLVSELRASKNVPQLDIPETTALAPESPVIRKLATPSVKIPEADGVYLYGQSPEPGVNGQGYIVFEQRQGRVTGALYMPNSEFSCFQGTVDNSGDLAMTVQSSPGEASVTQVASRDSEPNLDQNVPVHYAYSVALQDYHQLNAVSEVDKNILQMCKAE